MAVLAEDMFRALMNQAESAGDWSAAETAARELLLLNPSDETAAANEMALLAARGEYAKANRRLKEVSAALDGIDPLPVGRLSDVAGAIRAGEVRLHTDSAIPLVGRAAEFGSLKAHIGQAQAGHGGAVLILGKAGIGKTRLTEQAMRLATLRGFRIC